MRRPTMWKLQSVTSGKPETLITPVLGDTIAPSQLFLTHKSVGTVLAGGVTETVGGAILLIVT
jgi:hypothetical protein